MKVFGNKTTTDISLGQNIPNFKGENGNFSSKNKLKSYSVYNFFVESFAQYCHKFYAFFGNKKLKKSAKDSNFCRHSSDDDLPYHMKQKCRKCFPISSTLKTHE